MRLTATLAGLVLVGTHGVSALSIAAINGIRYLSPYNGQTVTNVTGVVTGKSSSGLFIQDLRRACDPRYSNGLYVYSSSLGKNASIALGDILTLSGKVSDYRSESDYLYSTELDSPKVLDWVRGGPPAKPLVIGKDTSNPPTEQFTSLDNGDVFGVPNNQSLISVVNPVLEPDKYGMDFWQSLTHELVTIQSPVAISKPNSYGETWMVGNWPTTGKNDRGGLTISSKDGNPEAIIVGAPLNGSKPLTTYKIGDTFADITGIIHYEFGFYYLLPLNPITYISSASPALPPPTSLESSGECSGITVGDYNVDNFAPTNTSHVEAVATHIATYMKTPDIVFLQEIQDNDGDADDGVVDATVTLSTLAAAIQGLSGVNYSFVEISPVNDQDGGEPGGNIRQAYLFKADVVRLKNGTAGGALDANEVLSGPDGPTLKYNPGRIDPTNLAWNVSRKPLAAEWETVNGGHNFFTVNVHWESKGGSTSLQGDPRPPVNLPVDKRTQQANITGTFIAQILALDPNASVIFGGDCNEFSVVQPMYTFEAVSKMIDLDVATGVPETERYTYTFGNDMEELDHMFVSPAIANKSPQQEHIHVNTWVSYSAQTSDHDPTVAKLNVCKS